MGLNFQFEKLYIQSAQSEYYFAFIIFGELILPRPWPIQGFEKKFIFNQNFNF